MSYRQSVGYSKTTDKLGNITTLQDSDYFYVWRPGDVEPKKIKFSDIQFDTDAFVQKASPADFPNTGASNRLYLAETALVDGTEYPNVLFAWRNGEYIYANERNLRSFKQTIPLGDISTQSIEAGFNAYTQTTPVTIMSLGYTFITAIQNGEEKEYEFVGDSGVYDASNLAVAGDFRIVNPEATPDTTIKTLIEAKQIDPTTLTAGDYRFILGRVKAGDGRITPNPFYWDELSEETPDDATIIQLEGVTTGRFKAKIFGAVTYNIFGVKGNGIEDDAILIKKAHEYANANNLPVISLAGEYWLSEPNEIPIQTNTNWGKTIFHIDESKSSSTVPRFKIPKENGFEEVVLSDADKTSFLSKFKKDVSVISELSGYKNNLFIIEDANDVINRYGGSVSASAKNDIFVVEQGGAILGDVTGLITNYTSLKRCTIDVNYLSVNGGVFKLNNVPNPNTEYTNMLSGFLVERVKTKISNQVITLEEDADPDTTLPYDSGFYFTRETFDFTIDGVKIPPRKYIDSGTYSFNFDKVFDLTLRNIISEADSSYWGTMGARNVKDLQVDNCRLNRIDVHSNAWNVYVDRSKIGDGRINLTGGGDLHISATTVTSKTFVLFRLDHGARWDGDIRIENNCTLISNTLYETRILRFTPTDFDYGYPLIFGHTITVKDFSVQYKYQNNTSELQLVEFPNFTPTTSENYYFPELIHFESIKVSGRDIGARLLKLAKTGHFRVRKIGGFNEAGQMIPNCRMVFKNIDTYQYLDSDIDDVTFFPGGLNEVADSNSLFPEVEIENCGRISLDFQNTKFNPVIKNCQVIFFKWLDTNNTQVGKLNFAGCIMEADLPSLQAGFVIQSTVANIVYYNCQWNTPIVAGVKLDNVSNFNSVLNNTMRLNERIYGTHINSILSKEVIDNFTIEEYFIESLGIHLKSDDPIIRRRKGSTSQRVSAAIPLGFNYFNTDKLEPEWWNGNLWINLQSVLDNRSWTESLNNLTNNGRYYAQTSATEKPNNINGYLDHYSFNNDFAMQNFTERPSGFRYFRLKESGVWGDWRFIGNRTVKTLSSSIEYVLKKEDFTTKELHFTANAGETVNLVLNEGVQPEGGSLKIVVEGNCFLKLVPGTGVTQIIPPGATDTTIGKGAWLASAYVAANTISWNGDLVKQYDVHGFEFVFDAIGSSIQIPYTDLNGLDLTPFYTQAFYATGTTALTWDLKALANHNSSVLKIVNKATATLTLTSVNTNNEIWEKGVESNSITIAAGESIDLANDNNNWVVRNRY